jgi:uncharacterized glyoxalase superfamily protein PhnB
MANPTTPPGWTRLSSALFYDDPRAALDFLAKAFGFATRVCVTDGDGGVVHAELELGDGVLQVSPSSRERGCLSPRAVGGACTQSVQVFVADIDAHCARALAAGATLDMPLTTKAYGDRSSGCRDLEGHLWWFTQRVDEAAWQRSTEPYRTPRA